MTAREVKRILNRNRLAGVRPWSFYQLAQIKGCNRSLFSQALKDRKRFRKAWLWLEETLRDGK